MSKLMTKEQYAEAAGVECPNCRHQGLITGTIEGNGSAAYQPVKCERCGARWVDCYTLTGYDNFEQCSSENAEPGRIAHGR